MHKTTTRLVITTLPLLLIAFVQLPGCTRRPDPIPPGGAYLSLSGGARFDQSVTIIDSSGTTTGGHIANLALRNIYRSNTEPSSILLAAGSSGIAASQDGGRSWSAVSGPDISVIDIVSLKNGAFLVAGTNQNNEGIVARSLDAGKSWETVLTVPASKKEKRKTFEILKPPPPTPSAVSLLVVDPFNPDQVYAATNTGELLLGQQSGKLWHTITRLSKQSIRTIIPSPHREGELLTVTSANILMRLRDGELTIIDTSKAKILDATYIKQFPDALFVGTGSGAIISRDEGETWQAANLPINISAPLRSSITRVSPNNPARLIVGVNNVIFRSEDGGETWNSFSLNLPNHIITDISINPANAAEVLLITRPLAT